MITITVRGGGNAYVESCRFDVLGPQADQMEKMSIVTPRAASPRTSVWTFSYAGYSLGSLMIAAGALAVLVVTLTYGQ